MQQTNYITRVLTPNDGYVITQANDNILLKDRIFSNKLYLAVNDDPDNYMEITVKEAEMLKQKQEIEIENEHKMNS